jgi:hypothetical protein
MQAFIGSSDLVAGGAARARHIVARDASAEKRVGVQQLLDALP